MPNWVFNTLSVSGDKATLDEMVAQLNKPVTKHFPQMNFDKDKGEWVNTPDVQIYNNPIFSFWNVVAPTDLEAYYGDEVFKKDKKSSFNEDGSFNNENFMSEFIRSMAEDQDWYHWNCRNWGTKWDIASADGDTYGTTMEVNDDGDVVYRFETAWSPVHEVLTKLSKMYPTLEFGYYYEEEQGWGGEDTIIDGEVVESKEWDIPSSHADHTALDRECNCECEPDYPEFWYKDCPVDKTKYHWVDGEWQELEMSDPNAMIDLSN